MKESKVLCDGCHDDMSNEPIERFAYFKAGGQEFKFDLCPACYDFGVLAVSQSKRKVALGITDGP